MTLDDKTALYQSTALSRGDPSPQYPLPHRTALDAAIDRAQSRQLYDQWKEKLPVDRIREEREQAAFRAWFRGERDRY